MFSGNLARTVLAGIAFALPTVQGATLLHHWKLDGDATDSAGGANGTAQGGASYAAGRFGQAVSLDGIDDSISTSAGVIVPATDYTLTAWVFWDGEAANGSRGYIAGGQTSGSQGEVFTMGRAAAGTDRKLFLNLLPTSGTATMTESADGTISTGAWQHVAYTVDSVKGTTIYLNGVVVGTNATRTTHTPASNFNIGNNPGTGAPNHFDGLIDDVAIFNGVLTSGQINNTRTDGAQHFNSDSTAPSITGTNPDGGTDAYPGAKLIATFSEDIALKPGGTITVTDLDDGSGTIVITLPNAGRISVAGPDLIIDPGAHLESGTHYEVVIANDTLEDTAGTPNAYPGTTAGEWTFTTAPPDLTAPVITLRSPADDATEVLPNATIVATFDDRILAGTGNIVIKDLDDGTTTRTVAVTDASQVTIAGKVLSIDPAALLAPDRNYAVQIPAAAVTNFSDVPFAGIPGTDETTWNFRTRAANPNVIFILGDDQAWYDYSFMNRPGIEKTAIDLNPSIYRVAQTPAIDRLADEGLTFTHGYATPICRPSLASIITGAFPHQTLITGNDLASGNDAAVEARMQVLHPLPRTLANELGYTCFQTGKWWEGHHNNGGFTHGDTVNSTAGGTSPSQWSAGKPGYVTARHGDWGLMTGRVDYINDVAAPADPIPYANTVRTATDFINIQVTAKQPFFLWYAPFLPHTPHDPPTGLIGKYDALISEPNESGNYFAKYYANIERFDGGVGAILDHLDATGIADNTIVIMICDNGWINQTNASAYAARSKQTPYEGGIRTPIIVRWPDRIKPGGDLEPQVITTPVSLVDLVPTVHDALGLSTFPEMTGVSLLDPGAVAARDTIFSEDSQHDIQDLNDPSRSLEARVAIRDGWKLILHTNGNSELYHLYNTATDAPVDPFETNDLSGRNPALVDALTTAIAGWYNHSFGSWIADPGFGVAPGARGFGDDPDGDGNANGLENFFGTDPGASSAGVVSGVVNAGTFTFTHPQNPHPADDITAAYRWSDDLEAFHANGASNGSGTTVSFATALDTPRAGTTTVTATITGAEVPELLFVDVEVTRN